MLIPNVKFLVLPLVALAVIAGLPSSGTGEPQAQARNITVPTKAVAGCDQLRGTANCMVASTLSNAVVVR